MNQRAAVSNTRHASITAALRLLCTLIVSAMSLPSRVTCPRYPPRAFTDWLRIVG
jgi:hypothetical protein